MNKMCEDESNKAILKYRDIRKSRTKNFDNSKRIVRFDEKKTEIKDFIPDKTIPETTINKTLKKSISNKDKKIFKILPKLEIIDSNGKIIKEDIKYSKDNEEFIKKRGKKCSGEFKIAIDFFRNLSKEKDEFLLLTNEDIKTNTVKNQFVGKLEKVDAGNKSKNIKK